VAASYILTGEHKSFTSPTPRKAFDPKNRGWGAWEVAARVSDFSAERGLYNYGFATPAQSPRRAREWVGGVNWYLNRLLRISADYGNTNFASVSRATERVVIVRLQVNFI
jgi:phosphate-selective porin OprO/OprP